MFKIGVLLPLILTFLVGLLSKGGNAQVTDTHSELLKSSKSVTDRVSGCPEGQQREGKFCCLPCLPGERKHSDCKTDGDKLTCVLCQEGEEYTDREHYSDKCRRCRSCDGEHGLEVEKVCTKTQNTKCRCKPDFFCSTPPCDHCNPCRRCEHGSIENCTPTKDTRCKEGLKKRYRNNDKFTPSKTICSPQKMTPVNLADIDLSDYITTIAEQMKIKQVRDFVRKNGINEAKIDEIKNDNLQDTAEQKVQLLRYWYQLHGKRDACSTLITSLRKADLCALAEKIQDIIQKDITSKCEKANSNNENESQNLIEMENQQLSS